MQLAGINIGHLPGVSFSTTDSWMFGSEPIRLVGPGAFRVAAELITHVHEHSRLDVFVARPHPDWMSTRRSGRWRRIRPCTATVASVVPRHDDGQADRVMLVITDAHRWRLSEAHSRSIIDRVAEVLGADVAAVVSAASEVGLVIVDPLDRLDVEPSPMSFILAGAPFVMCDEHATVVSPTPLRAAVDHSLPVEWQLAG